MKVLAYTYPALLLSVPLLLPGCSDCESDLTPRSWPEAGIHLGEGRIERRHIATVAGVPELCDVALGRIDGDEREHLILTGYFGYALLDPETGAERARVEFETTKWLGAEDNGTRGQALDVDGDGRLEFVRFGEHWLSKTSVHDRDGAALWVHPANDELVPNMTWPGDLDGDGRLEFLMAFNATEEIHLIDDRGHLVWSQLWSSGLGEGCLRLIDVDGIAGLEVAYVDGEALWVRDAQGEVLSRVEPPDGGYVNALDVLDDFEGRDGRVLRVGAYIAEGPECGQHWYLFSPDGQHYLERVATDADAEPYLNVLPAQLGTGGEQWYVQGRNLAREGTSSRPWRSHLELRVFDEHRELVYHEFTEAPDARKTRGGGLFVLPPRAGSLESRTLAVYGPDVWEYVRSK